MKHGCHSRVRGCPACNLRGGGTSLRQKWGFDLLACGNCRTLYVPVLPDSLNEQDYDSYYHANNLVTPGFIAGRLDEIVATFSKYRQHNRLLDLGCGAGTLLQAAARAGWAAEGLDVSRTAAQHVSSLGFKVFCGGILEASYPNARFDVVTASELLEHVPDPRGLVTEVARILRPGGLFWLTTPHSLGLSGRLLGTEWTVVSPPEHLQLFSRRGMQLLLTAAGFSQVRVATRGVNPFEIVHWFRRAYEVDGGSQKNRSMPRNVFDRVGSGYKLNEALTKSWPGRFFKRVSNNLLGVSHLGDSLKIRAEK